MICLSKYRYGNNTSSRKSDERVKRTKEVVLNHEVIEEEVAALRESIDEIHDLLSEISELSSYVQSKIDDLEDSIVVLEEEI